MIVGATQVVSLSLSLLHTSCVCVSPQVVCMTLSVLYTSCVARYASLSLTPSFSGSLVSRSHVCGPKCGARSPQQYST